MSVIAVVPARAGSQEIRHKNTTLLAGKPLVAHILTTLQVTEGIDRIVVTTDDPQVKAIAVTYGVDILDRPEQLADDTATLDEVMDWVHDELG